jgi:hypothetical protein
VPGRSSKSSLPAPVQRDLAVPPARRLSRQFYDWQPLHAAVGECPDDEAPFFFLNDLYFHWNFRHRGTRSRKWSQTALSAEFPDIHFGRKATMTVHSLSNQPIIMIFGFSTLKRRSMTSRLAA